MDRDHPEIHSRNGFDTIELIIGRIVDLANYKGSKAEIIEADYIERIAVTSNEGAYLIGIMLSVDVIAAVVLNFLYTATETPPYVFRRTEGLYMNVADVFRQSLFFSLEGGHQGDQILAGFGLLGAGFNEVIVLGLSDLLHCRKPSLIREWRCHNDLLSSVSRL